MVPQDLKVPAVFVIGPTASGKTALAHALADTLPFLTLLNLDALQFYQGVTAGTAKPSAEEIESYGYSLVDFLPASARFDAQEYARLAREACERALAAGNLPLCVGGSGLYLRALLHGLDNLPPADADFRARLRAEVASGRADAEGRSGWPAAHARLAVVDAVRAAELHPNDGTRIERALEIYALTGKPMSAARERLGVLKEQPSLFVPFVVRVEPDRDTLKARIAARTRSLVGRAWKDEVEGLFAAHDAELRTFQSFQAIGYAQMLDVVQGRRLWDADALTAEIETLTWQYARRQLTWNRKETAHAIVETVTPREIQTLAEKISVFRESLHKKELA